MIMNSLNKCRLLERADMRRFSRNEERKRATEQKNNLKIKVGTLKEPLSLIISLKPQKHFSLPQGDSSSYCLSVLKNEMPYIKPFSCY